MTLTTTQDQNILDILMVIIKRKQDYEKEGKAIKKLEAIYSEELKAIASKMHKTAGGELTLIENMTDEHLLNTIKVFLRNNHWDYSDVPKRYLDEAKKRKGMLEQLIDYEVVIEQDDRIDIGWRDLQ